MLSNFICLQIKSFRDYVELYLRGISPTEEEDDIPRKIVHEVVNPRWEVAVTASPSGFQQSSFVNSIATTKVHASHSMLTKWFGGAMCVSLPLCEYFSGDVTNKGISNSE